MKKARRFYAADKKIVERVANFYREMNYVPEDHMVSLGLADNYITITQEQPFKHFNDFGEWEDGHYEFVSEITMLYQELPAYLFE